MFQTAYFFTANKDLAAALMLKKYRIRFVTGNKLKLYAFQITAEHAAITYYECKKEIENCIT